VSPVTFRVYLRRGQKTSLYYRVYICDTKQQMYEYRDAVLKRSHTRNTTTNDFGAVCTWWGSGHHKEKRCIGTVFFYKD
jgi:hypothetical protein